MTKCYTQDNARKVRYVYIIFIVLWSIFIIYNEMYTTLESWASLIPYITFGIAIYYSDKLSCEVEDNMFKVSFLSVGVILIFPMLSYMCKNYAGNNKHFVAIAITAMVSTLLSFIDIWVPLKLISIQKHIKSCFQTISITLIIYAFISYFINQKCPTLL
jgi:hypothetical protein